MTNNNSTFCGDEPTWANACVGHNGSPSYIEYSSGFSQAANLLIDQVISQQGLDYSVDEFVYPVCFNMRHSVELRLKGAIEILQKIGKMKGVKLLFNLSGSHDIKIIWEFFKTESEKIDSRYVDINKKLEPTILDIAEVDSTGQTFRYPISSESQKHLTEISVINFIVLKEKFHELENHLELLHRINIYLYDEYYQGTFTKKLSRAELFRLAKELPPKNTWGEPHFDLTKDSLKKTYNLSSNDLSKAITIIINHYEMSSFVGILTPLLGVTKEEIITFLDEWVKLHKKKEYNYENGAGVIEVDIKDSLRQMHNDYKQLSKSWNVISETLTPEILAGLKALFYFARDKEFSESYISTYEYMLKESKIYFEDSVDYVKRSFSHLFEKTNFLHNVLVSLYFLGYSILSEELIEHYDVKKTLPLIERARTRELFQKPDFCGY
ncbi:MAG: hypothetical protein ACD_23C01400G0003 [uncultured bacterium]|nr:MAG: hypothetical protein ACD_23C01400G0003 [uncultured bacterium]